MEAGFVPVSGNRGTVGALITLRPAKNAVGRRAVAGADVAARAVSSELQRAREAGVRAVASGKTLLIIGEAGSGKSTLAREILAADAEQRRLDEFDLRLLAGEPGPDAEATLERVLSGLSDGASDVLLSHADSISGAVSSRLVATVAALKQESMGTAIVMTAQSSGSGHPENSGLLAISDAVVSVAPLRKRSSEISVIATGMVRDFVGQGTEPGLDSKAVTALMRHDWPGNMRELRRVLYSALLNSNGNVITFDDLPQEYQHQPARLRKLSRIQEAERVVVSDALRDSGWNGTAAAELLGVSRATIYRKMRQLDISRPI
jgi:transcriptional regulator of acetoin/glycerol metabolism